MKNRLFPRNPLPLCKPLRFVQFGQESCVQFGQQESWFVQFGQESCPAGEYLHSERLWMLEKVSAALKTTPTTIPQTPHIPKIPVQLGNTFTQSGCGCLKKCLQLSILLPLPSHELHPLPKIHKKKLGNNFDRQAEGYL